MTRALLVRPPPPALSRYPPPFRSLSISISISSISKLVRLVRHSSTTSPPDDDDDEHLSLGRRRGPLCISSPSPPASSPPALARFYSHVWTVLGLPSVSRHQCLLTSKRLSSTKRKHRSLALFGPRNTRYAPRLVLTACTQPRRRVFVKSLFFSFASRFVNSRESNPHGTISSTTSTTDLMPRRDRVRGGPDPAPGSHRHWPRFAAYS